jgi:long-chain acyl-CoA synthetase
LLFRVELTGLENLPKSGAYIMSPNHQSYLDPFMLCAMLPFRVFQNLFFVGAVEYFETSLTQWFARLANLVPVDPDSNLVPAMKAGAFGLAHGRVLVLFPEGERSIDGMVKKFKRARRSWRSTCACRSCRSRSRAYTSCGRAAGASTGACSVRGADIA